MLLQAVKVLCLTLLYLGACLKETLCEELIVNDSVNIKSGL